MNKETFIKYCIEHTGTGWDECAKFWMDNRDYFDVYTFFVGVAVSLIICGLIYLFILSRN